MKFCSKTKPVRQFSFASVNQHGDRFKEITPKYVYVVTLSAGVGDAVGLRQLAILSDQLNVPLGYDFDDQEAFIKITDAKNI